MRVRDKNMFTKHALIFCREIDLSFWYLFKAIVEIKSSDHFSICYIHTGRWSSHKNFSHAFPAVLLRFLLYDTFLIRYRDGTLFFLYDAIHFSHGTIRFLYCIIYVFKTFFYMQSMTKSVVIYVKKTN